MLIILQIEITGMRKLSAVLWMCMAMAASAQNPKKTNTQIERPKLVVGIVVDQMRWDYLYRYYDRYSNDGFKRLLNGGFTCENTFIPYTPTYTAAGHASIYTGSVPAVNGIIGNYWYNRQLGRQWYCTEDSTVTTVGSSSKAGMMSPRNMWATSVADELKLATAFESKVIGIALKDRGAILPAGHAANAAYWFDNANGSFISSSYYMKELPQWLQRFNNRHLADSFLAQNWNLLYPVNTYKQTNVDSIWYENKLPGEDNSFPHVIANIDKDKYEALRHTPYGNTLTFEMAKAAIAGEQLGKGKSTDMLAVSFSSPDYMGHTFGPNSLEAEDMYLRLDLEFAAFFKYLDQQVGAGNYLIFLTADHGVAHIGGYLREHKMPGGAKEDRNIEKTLNGLLERNFSIIHGVSKVTNYQVYLNHKSIAAVQMDAVKKLVIDSLMVFPYVANAFDLQQLGAVSLPHVVRERILNGYNQKLSGDIQFIYKPGWYDGWDRGTTHGAWNAYDAHIPLLWYGWNIKKGATYRETYMTDIAATLAAILHIQMPSGCVGKVVEEVLK